MPRLIRDLLCGKSYWVTKSRVWQDFRNEYHPQRMCKKCGYINRFATPYCPKCGRTMSHETVPTGIIPKEQIIEDEHGQKYWGTLYDRERVWNFMLHKGVSNKVYRQHEEAEKKPTVL